LYQLLEKNPSITVLKSTKERKHKVNILHRYKKKELCPATIGRGRSPGGTQPG